MNTPRRRLALHRRGFLTSTASGLGAAAFLSLLRDDGVLAADGPGAGMAPRAPSRLAAPFPAEGQELHLHLPGRGHEPGRAVRPQAEARLA